VSEPEIGIHPHEAVVFVFQLLQSLHIRLLARRTWLSTCSRSRN
jgi:hypothetical protein